MKDDPMSDRRSRFTRREVVVGSLMTPLLARSSGAASAKIRGEPGQGTRRTIELREGTNIAAVASHDGRQIAFDLVASLWVIDTAGGDARRLTDDLADIAQPDWSPDGSEIAYQSYRDGNFHIWVINLKDRMSKQLTDGPFDCREPRFSPDGRKIAFSSDRGGSYGVHVLDRSSGVISTLVDSGADECEPSWSPDGRKVVFVTNKSKVEIIDDSGKRSTVAGIEESHDIMLPREVHSPAFTPDGTAVIYTVIADGKAELHKSGQPLVVGEDVFPFRISWLPNGEYIYTSNGKIRRRALGAVAAQSIEYSADVTIVEPDYSKKALHPQTSGPRQVIGIGSPVLSPDGTRIAFRALNDIWIMQIGHAPRALTKDRFYKSDPAFSPDGRQLVYSSDRGGTLDLWLLDLQSSATTQLTHLQHAAVSASWSPDGKLLAFLDQAGNLYTIDSDGGNLRKVLGPLWEPGRPSFGPMGKCITLAAFRPYSGRYREGLSEILTVDLGSGKIDYRPVLPHRSLGTRGDDGPVWSPDGTQMAFVFASLLHVMGVDANGTPTAPPRAINAEVTDAPSWSGDSRTLLYLSNGNLRMIGREGGAARSVPLNLHWTMPPVKERTLIRAGNVWDGKSPELRRDVDIVLDGDRIAGLHSKGSVGGDANMRVVDARHLSVMPGLMDMHTHRQMQGYSYGDRQGRLWLSMGITTTRSVGAPAYHMVEDRESIQSGARLAPRHFATGEAIDGGRIYYNFMRPVTEPGQMQLELQRAKALSYDMIKTYVRLSPETQREVIDWAHAEGLRVSSHYHYPAAAFGIDGMEHLGATSRFGYSRTVSALGAGYQDVIAFFSRGRTYRTPTLFTSGALLGSDRSLVDDARIKTLYPPWEYARLVEHAKQMAGPAGAVVLQSLERNVAQVRDSMRSGARIISGTDAPIDFLAVSLHLNLRGMVRYGMSPYEALLTATSIPGEFLGQPLGVVEPGAFADLIMVDGDPLADIDAVARVQQVVANGRVYSREELMAPFVNAVSPRPTAMVVMEQPPANLRYWWHSPGYVEGGRHACCMAGPSGRGCGGVAHA
jgi:Tol biopolymer transport system component